MDVSKAVIYRVGAGKALGLAVGLVGFLLLPLLIDEPSLLFRSAVLLWYPTVGAFVGLFGIFSYHPVLNFPMPWWFRGAIIGGWMNFLIVLFAYDQMSAIMMGVFGEYHAFVSPFWLVLEGVLIGMVFDLLLTEWFGEGWVDKPND